MKFSLLPCDFTKEYILAIEALLRGKIFSLIIKSSLWEGIFVDDKDVNCKSLETMRAKNIFDWNLLEAPKKINLL